jgi:hypothetical protein
MYSLIFAARRGGTSLAVVSQQMSMTQLASFARLAVGAGVVALFASACGGKSFIQGDGDEGGSSAQGGSGSQAGTTAKAGSSSSAGTGNTHTGGTGSGTGGTGSGTGGFVTAGTGAGGGGYAGEACTAGPDPGPCEAYLETWYHDAATGICRPSFYGGCGGNANRYTSLAECQKACSGGTPNYDSCKLPSDCTVAGTGCCGVCDSAGLTVHDFIAYNDQYTNVFNCSTLKDIAAPEAPGAAPAGGSSGVNFPPACAPCPEPTGTGALKYFVPDCVAGQCVVTDLRNSPVTACKTSDECKLRSGTGCCEGCDGSNLLAVRNDGSFEKLICGGLQPPCAACAPQPPSGAVALCNEGHCVVAYAADAGNP